MSPKATVFLTTTLAVVALDQASKALVRANLRPYAANDEVEIIPNYLSISHAINKGAAFSALADFEYRIPVFLTFTAVAVLAIGLGYRLVAPRDRLQVCALGVLLAGVLGNAIDRAVYGEVTDMIKVYAGNEPLKSWFIQRWHTNVWPIFNVADSAIWVGAIGFILVYAAAHIVAKDEPAGPAPTTGPPESAPSLD